MTKYRLMKNFTPEDLFLLDAPKELILAVMKYNGEEFTEECFGPYTYENLKEDITETGSEAAEFFNDYQGWFIENGFIGVVETPLKPGMVLKETNSERKLRMVINIFI